jgi:hypothetical protein
MAASPGARVRLIFAVSNALVALILLVGVFGLIQPRFWALDVPAGVLALVEVVSAISLFARLPWALRALSLAAWITFVGGLVLVGLIVLTMVFLRSIHGEDGFVATAVSGLVVLLLVPYTLLLPIAQLLWLKRQTVEQKS